MKVERIGDRLVSSGVISNDQLEFALKEQKRTGERLGTILRQLNLITEEDLAKVLAESAGIEHLNIRNLSIDPNVVSALPEAVAIAGELGLDIYGHRARSVTKIDLERFHLVLGFERKHVMSSVVDAEALIEHTFTLPELVELLEGLPTGPEPADPIERALLRIRRAHEARAPDYRARPFPEVDDPLGMTMPAQRKTAHELEALVSELVQLLFD